jgi:hypothetical protein
MRERRFRRCRSMDRTTSCRQQRGTTRRRHAQSPTTGPYQDRGFRPSWPGIVMCHCMSAHAEKTRIEQRLHTRLQARPVLRCPLVSAREVALRTVHSRVAAVRGMGDHRSGVTGSCETASSRGSPPPSVGQSRFAGRALRAKVHGGQKEPPPCRPANGRSAWQITPSMPPSKTPGSVAQRRQSACPSRNASTGARRGIPGRGNGITAGAGRDAGGGGGGSRCGVSAAIPVPSRCGASLPWVNSDPIGPRSRHASSAAIEAATAALSHLHQLAGWPWRPRG